MVKIRTYRLELDAEKHPVLVMEQEAEYRKEPLTDPQRIVDLCNNVMNLKAQAEEHIVMMAMNNKGMLLGLFQVGHGSVNQAICNPREIYIRALAVGASHIAVAHNHPSGDCEPSQYDISAAKRLDQAGNILGIQLRDFIIIGEDTYYSARISGALE